MKEMAEHIEGATTVLIAEGEKFVPNLRSTVDAHLDCNFTITTQNMLYAKVLSRILKVTICDDSGDQHIYLWLPE